MPNSPFTINGFKYGLDTRKDVLSSQPGTLVTLENAYVNQGAEIQKRAAFVLFADVSALDTLGDAGTFGIESTSSGIVVFGSALVFGTTPSQSQPVLASAMPSGVTYQQLKHPTLVNDSSESYSRTLHRMTQLVFSENYNGLAFACAKFADGRKFFYYDGNLIQQSANGLVMTGRIGVTDLSVDLARQINALGWYSLANVKNDLITAQNGSTIVQSPQADYFDAVPTDDSTAGYIGHKKENIDGAAIAGSSAVASFQVTVNTGPFTVTAPEFSDGTGTVDLCGGPVSAAGSVNDTAEAIKDAINDLSDFHGYTALRSGANVYVYADSTWGNFTFNLTVTGTSVGASAGSPGAVSALLVPETTSDFGYYVIVTTTSVLVQSSNSPSVEQLVSGNATIAPTGGTAPYSYVWSETTPGSGNGIDIGNSTSQTVTFSKLMAKSTDLSGSFRCLVTDSAAVSYQLNVTVFLIRP
jgi:hypothetical protein